MTFEEFHAANVERSNQAFGKFSNGTSNTPWSGTDWGCALAGEVGELCNLIKKRRRGDDIPTEAIAKELADVFAYLDLVADHFGIDLESAIVSKWNEVSERVGWPKRLTNNVSTPAPGG